MGNETSQASSAISVCDATMLKWKIQGNQCMYVLPLPKFYTNYNYIYITPGKHRCFTDIGSVKLAVLRPEYIENKNINDHMCYDQQQQTS